jgi:thiol-disulfide isomerase/thioredoxin
MKTINKKKTIIGTCLVLILLSGNLIGCVGIASVKQQVKDSANLPDFDILLADTVTKFNTGKIAGEKPIVLFFFGPNCSSCDTVTRNILTHIDMFKDVRLLMLSGADFHDVKVYEERYQLKKYEDIILGQDVSNLFLQFYGASRFPFFVIFDKNKKLKRANVGPLSVDTIRAIIDK